VNKLPDFAPPNSKNWFKERMGWWQFRRYQRSWTRPSVMLHHRMVPVFFARWAIRSILRKHGSKGPQLRCRMNVIPKHKRRRVKRSYP